jgi:hypothetical protein
MFGISLQELAFAYQAADNCEINVRQSTTAKGPSWTIEVVLFDERKKYFLQGQRGAPRTWRDFDRAASVLQDTCPGLREITVTFSESSAGYVLGDGEDVAIINTL